MVVYVGNCESTLLATNMEFIGGESLDYEGCTLNYSEEDIDNIIMDIFEYSFDVNSSK